MVISQDLIEFNYPENRIKKFTSEAHAYLFIDTVHRMLAHSAWEKEVKEKWLLLLEYMEVVEYDGFVDLGLPSGTKWKRINEDENDYFTFGEALKEFGKKSLPSNEDFEELLENCRSEWDDARKGRIFIGPNGNNIFFPALGYRAKSGSTVINGGSSGYYWSSSISGEQFAIFLYFDSNKVDAGYNCRWCGNSVRLVQK